MSTTEAPEPRPTLLDPETSDRLQREEGVIKTLGVSAISAGNTALETYFHAIEMADAIREYHEVVARLAREVSSKAGHTFHRERADDAEHLRLWFLNLLDQAITGKPEASPAIASIRIRIGTANHGGLACRFMNHEERGPLGSIDELHEAFLNAKSRKD